MILTKIRLRNFRNFAEYECEFDPRITIISGKNALGKTNILESIFFIFTGKGLKDQRQQELIKFDELQAEVEAETANDDGHSSLFKIFIQDHDPLKKTFLVDKNKKTYFSYLKETLPVVVFSPELISIIDGQPSERRRFFDHILSTIDLEYKKRLRNYEQGMRRRNKVIEKAERPEGLKEELAFWNDYLIEHATYVVEKRKWLIEEFNANPELGTHEFQVEYKENAISHQRFEDYFMKEFYQKRTLIGPQRDEINILKKNGGGKFISTNTYSSRGEQRLALFWLIVNQLKIYVDHMRLRPLLLLDDIFSELDATNRDIIFQLINTYQTIITSTPEELNDEMRAMAKEVKL